MARDPQGQSAPQLGTASLFSAAKAQRGMVVNYLSVKRVPYFTCPLHCPGTKFVFFLEPQMGHCLTQPQPHPSSSTSVAGWLLTLGEHSLESR